MPLVLAAAVASDVPLICKNEAEVFAPWPVYANLFPNGASAARRAVMEATYYDMLANNPTMHLLKVTDTATGQIVSTGWWNIWDKPRDQAQLDASREIKTSPDARSLQSCQELSDLISETRQKTMGGRPHIRACPCSWRAPCYFRDDSAKKLGHRPRIPGARRSNADIALGLRQGRAVGLARLSGSFRSWHGPVPAPRLQASWQPCDRSEAMGWRRCLDRWSADQRAWRRGARGRRASPIPSRGGEALP